MRVERRPGPRSGWWRSRPDEVHITLPLRRAQDLFTAPGADPYDPDYDRYEPIPGVERILSALQAGRSVAVARLTLAMPEEAAAPGLGERVAGALGRYARARAAMLDEQLAEARRHGVRLLVLGLLVVFVLNSTARALEQADDAVLSVIADGLSIASWVTLWFPINVLIYDRWYLRRERNAYARMGEISSDPSARSSTSQRLRAHGGDAGRRHDGGDAGQLAVNPTRLWDPSQNGLLAD